MWAFLIPLVEKLAVSLAPSILSWIGDEALSAITGHVNAENATRAAIKTQASIAQAEAAAPKTDDAIDVRLKEHSI